MGGDDYVIDEKRGMAWGNPWDALKWYREQLEAAEESLRKALVELTFAECDRRE